MRQSLGISLVLVVLGACGKFNAARDVEKALEARYQTPARVHIDSGRLAVTFEGMPEEAIKADSAGKVAFARAVAGFAKARAPKPAELTTVVVSFAAIGNGPVMIRLPGSGPFEFAVASLP